MTVCVVIYDRFMNLKKWIHCWKQCETENAELVIIHNFYGVKSELIKFKTYCEKHNIKYIPRNGQGYDIGAFQDVCLRRIELEYDFLIWCCDDTLPMQKDFIKQFIKKMQPGVGIAAMQIASSMAGEIHVRTTGFCMRKETIEKIQFQFDPIVTKHHCYLFEHRGKEMTLTNQVRAMGLSCVQVAKNESSPLWDTGYWKRLNRQKEFEHVFGYSDKVTFICTITHGGYPQIISSLLTQTNNNWELLLVHNGPSNGLSKELTKHSLDKRIKFVEVEDTGYWGHPNRARFLQEVQTEFVVITNNDNYIVPVFVEKMMKGFQEETVATYCSQMVHSYTDWNILECRLQRGFIDCAGVMLRTKEAQKVGWKDIKSHSADWNFFADLLKEYGHNRFVKVKGALLVHN